MKIVFLNIYQDLVNRGAETFVCELAKRLSKNHEVVVVQGGSSKKNYQIIKIGGVSLFPTDKPDVGWRVFHKFYLDRYSRQVFTFTKKALPYIKKIKPDWVVPLNGFWQLWQLKRLQKTQKFKILVSGQAGPGKDDYWNLRLKPDVFVALTESFGQWAQKASKKIKIVVIPNGVDLEKYNKKVKPKELNFPKPIILCVGALVPYKNIDLTIRAVSKLPKASLIVLGEGPMEKFLRKMGQELLPNRFLMVSVSPEEIPSFYSAADVFTLASGRSEAFGIAYVEALASGKAIVAPCDPAKKEIIGNAGVFFDPKNVNSYVQSFKLALRKKWHDLPQKQAEKFSWDKIAKDYEKILEEDPR